MTKLLLDNGADPNLKNEKGETALHFASATGAFESMKALLEAKAIVDTPAEVSNFSIKIHKPQHKIIIRHYFPPSGIPINYTPFWCYYKWP